MPYSKLCRHDRFILFALIKQDEPVDKKNGERFSRERVIAVVEAIMGMQTAQIQSAYSTALMKRTMDDAESQVISLIQDMVASVPAPAQYAFDVYA